MEMKETRIRLQRGQTLLSRGGGLRAPGTVLKGWGRGAANFLQGPLEGSVALGRAGLVEAARILSAVRATTSRDC